MAVLYFLISNFYNPNIKPISMDLLTSSRAEPFQPRLSAPVKQTQQNKEEEEEVGKRKRGAFRKCHGLTSRVFCFYTGIHFKLLL